MANVPHTLMIGDSLGGQLRLAFQEMPGTGAIWLDDKGYPFVASWADGSAIDDFWTKLSSGPADKMPDTALIVLGRADIFNETNAGPNYFKQLGIDAGKIVDKIMSLGVQRVGWVLPPAIKNETGHVRQTLLQALAGKGVATFNGGVLYTDPTQPGQPPATLSDDIVQSLAGSVAPWIKKYPGASGFSVGPGAGGPAWTAPSAGAETPTPALPDAAPTMLSRPVTYVLLGAIFVGGAALYVRGTRRG